MVVFLAAALAALGEQYNSDPEETAKAVAMVSGRFGTTETFGAGIVFSREPKLLRIVTAAHVVRRGAQTPKDVTVYLRSAPNNPLRARLEPNVDPELDVAVLTVDDPAPQGIDVCAIPVDRLAMPGRLKRGDAVTPLGNPNGEKWIMPVKMDAIARSEDSEIKFESNGIAVGFSGGALLNEKMQIIGMIRGDEPPYGSAIGIDRVIDVLKSWKYDVHLVPQAPIGTHPLHVAVRDQDAPTVLSLLLQKCTNIEQPDNTQYAFTALHYAAANGRSLMVRMLLTAGANVNAKTRAGQSALEMAASAGSEPTVTELLAHGAAATTNALQNAASKGSLGIVQKLLTAGAKPDAAGPVIDAVRYPEILRALIEAGAGVNWRASQNASALQHAIQAGKLESVKMLLAAGADPTAVTSHGESMARLASHGSNRDILMLLIRSRPHLPADGLELLRYVANRGWGDLVAELVNRGVGQQGSLDTALVTAVEAGSITSVRALLNGGADPDPKSQTARSRPIVIAARNKDPETRRAILQLLIERGADVARKDGELRDTPAFIVMFELKPPDLNTAELLVAHIKDFSPPKADTGGSLLHRAAREGCVECVRLLIKAGSPVNAQSSYASKSTALHEALDHPEIVRMLLAAGARVDAQDGTPGVDNTVGETPLYQVAARTSANPALIETAKLLIAAHANVNYSYYGTTPLHWAAEHANEILVKLLLDSGANRLARDGEGKTAADRAKTSAIKALLVPSPVRK